MPLTPFQAWKQSTLELAEHMYNQIEQLDLADHPLVAEQLADALYEIGKDQAQHRHHNQALQWLERAFRVLETRDFSTFSETAPDLHLSIMHLLAKSWLAMYSESNSTEPTYLQKAQEIVELMGLQYPDKMILNLLQLEVLGATSNPDINLYYGALIRMFKSIDLTRPNFKTLMYHLHKLRKLNVETARKALDDFLVLRLFHCDNPEWIERAVMMRIWLTTSFPGKQSISKELKGFLEDVARNIASQLSNAAVHAAQSLLWKVVETEFNQKQFDSAEKLCRLCLHPLFDGCGDGNRGKIMRKTMICALSKEDVDAAREVYLQMPEAMQASPQTQFLWYKVALRCQDFDQACECLDNIARRASKDATFLYACIEAAQHARQKTQALLAMQKVLEKYSYSAPEGVHLPVLLRTTIRLLKAEIDKSKPLDHSMINRLCKLFEGAAKEATGRTSTGPTQFSKPEIEWFSRNSFNFTLEFCRQLHPLQLYQLVSSCTQFLDLLVSGPEDANANKLRQRQLLCAYIALTTQVVLARAEDSIINSVGSCFLQLVLQLTGQAQHYSTVRQYARRLRELSQSLMEKGGEQEVDAGDVKAKFNESVKFELEAVLRLKKWDDFDELFDVSNGSMG
jgi:hypothetical protein